MAQGLCPSCPHDLPRREPGTVLQGSIHDGRAGVKFSEERVRECRTALMC